jgi:hypothetical protein
MTDITTSQERYKLLSYEIEDLLKKLKERDDLWIDLGEQAEGNNYPDTKITSNITDKINEEVQKREKAWDIINDIYTEHLGILDGIDIQAPCPTNNRSIDLQMAENLTLERKYGYIDYIVSINNENIQLIYLLLIALSIFIIILTLRYLDIFNVTITLIFCISIITLYIFYLIKVTVLDRVNRNNIYFDKYDFNKPSDTEIKKSRDKDIERNKLEGNEIDESVYGKCKDDIYGRDPKSFNPEKDELLDKIKENQGSVSENKCLSYKP